MSLRLLVGSVFLGVTGCVLTSPRPVLSGGERALGLVRSSQGARLGGTAVPGSEVVFDGDLLATASGGTALVELAPGTRLSLGGGSFVRFVRDGEMVRAELASGGVVSESAGKPTLIVATLRHQFAPAGDGKCRYLVQLSPGQTPTAAALNGNVIVKSGKTDAGFVLREGYYAALSLEVKQAPAQSEPAGATPAVPLAGTVLNVTPDAVVQRQAQGTETGLKEGDSIDVGDLVMTRQSGRARIMLVDGSQINLGPGSTLKVAKHQPQPQQTQLELTAGHLRVWVAKLSQPGSSWTVQTPTAMAVAVGTDSFIVDAQPHAASIYAIDGLTVVRSADPAAGGSVTLQPGQFTTINSGSAPSGPGKATDPLLQAQLDATDVGPTVPSGQRAAAPAPPSGWHIGPLSAAEAAGIAVGAAGITAASIAIYNATASSNNP